MTTQEPAVTGQGEASEERGRIAARIEYTLDTDLDSFAAGSPAHERAKAVVGTMRIAARIARDPS